MMEYEQPSAGGTWEHRSGDCKHHGGNIPFAKPYKSVQPYLCVECMKSFTRRLQLKRLRDACSAHVYG